jgi:hypothetical protein
MVQNNIDYRKESDRLSDALDVIARFEVGDQIRLKQAIRAERDRLDAIADELEG